VFSLLAQAADVRLFQEMGAKLERLFQAFIEPAASSLMGALQGTALVGASLYILLMGFSILFGGGSPVYTFFRTSLKISVVCGLALSSDLYLGGIVGGLRGLETGLVGAMSGGEIEGGIFEQLDSVATMGFRFGDLCFLNAARHGPLSPGVAMGWIFSGAVVMFSTGLLVFSGGAVVLLAKFAISILFALGPFFVLCLMFPQSSGFFDKWLSQCLSFVFQTVLVGAILSFAVSMFYSFVSVAAGMVVKNAVTSPTTASLQLFVVSLVMGYLIWKTGEIASGLSGGASSAAVSAREAGSRALGYGKAAVGGAIAGVAFAAAAGRSFSGSSSSVPSKASNAATRAAIGSVGPGSVASASGASRGVSASPAARAAVSRPGGVAPSSASSASSGLRAELQRKGQASPARPLVLDGSPAPGGLRGLRSAAISSFAASPARSLPARSSLSVLSVPEKPSSPKAPRRALPRSL
jgi:type IV secretion system protein VirB6